VSAGRVTGVVLAAGRAPIDVCRCRNGNGHPFWLRRIVFAELARLHGDKRMCKLVESSHYRVTEVDVDGTVPLDVDTWDGHDRLLTAGRR